MYELNCQAIKRKCALDREVSVKTIGLNVSLDVGQYLTWYQV